MLICSPRSLYSFPPFMLSQVLELDVKLHNLCVEIYMKMVKQHCRQAQAKFRFGSGRHSHIDICDVDLVDFFRVAIVRVHVNWDYSSFLCIALLAARYSATCWAGVLIIRILCIFNVLKANQLFLFHFPFLVHPLSRLISSSVLPYAPCMVKISFQIRVVFLYWLPCLLRMSRPGQEAYECAPIPTGGSSEKAKQMNDVELRERYVNVLNIRPYIIATFIFSLKILIAFDRFFSSLSSFFCRVFPFHSVCGFSNLLCIHSKFYLTTKLLLYRLVPAWKWMWISAVEIDTNCLNINQIQFMFAVSFPPFCTSLALRRCYRTEKHSLATGHRNHCWPMCLISTMISDAIIVVTRYRTTQPIIVRFIGKGKMEASAPWEATKASEVEYTRPFPIHASVRQLNMN